MLYLSIALLIVAAMAFFLINKWMDIQTLLNTKVTEVALSTAVEDRLSKLENLKTEFEALKLMVGLKNGR